MQQNTGLLVGLIICGILAALFGVMYFHANTEIDRLRANLSGASMETLSGDPYNNKNVAALATQRNQLYQAETERLEEIANLTREEERLKAAVAEEQRRVKEKDADIKRRDGELATEKKNHLATVTGMRGMRKSVEQSLTKEQEDSRPLYRQADDLVQKRMDEGRQLMEKNALEVKREKEKVWTLRNQIVNLQQQIARYAGEGAGGAVAADADREKAERGDGEVLEADIDRRRVVVSLGQYHKARPGMRFDVKRRLGETMMLLAQIELVRVEEMVSEAAILESTIQIKRCPATGWETADEDMKYSPYALTWIRDGAGGYVNFSNDPDVPIELEVVKHESNLGMDPLNPVAKGDRIFNPMFNPNRQDRFIIVGEPVLHTREQIALAVRDYGSLLVDKMAPDVNYVVLCRMPEADDAQSDEARKYAAAQITALSQARAYGIPLIREAEIIGFLNP